ncbi:MAG: AAA family ATPase, partial [Deltaproteobacteria bacterium]|nr:AAA family ATPase [Deltaproteobacteria bacterium]
MAVFIKHVAAKNYRALADLTLDLGEVDVLFGPNGAGKSTLLDVLWFIRDCAVRGAAEASATRSHGIGMLFDGVDEDEPLEVSIETNHVTYALKLSLSSGRLEAFPGERLRSLHDDVTFIDRSPGSTRASFFHAKLQEPVLVSLREPEKLSLTRYLDFEEDAADIAELDRRLRFIRFYPARTANFRAIKRFGSERGYESWVFGDGTNLWSVLSNIHNKMAADDRYATIMGFMRESFPSFKDLVFETTGATSVYGSFVERGRRKPILASGVSDGHLQML